jgi:hypothetical protein
MAERIYAIALDVRDRTRRAEFEVAAHKRHAHGIARLERSFEWFFACTAGGHAAPGWHEPLLAECACQHVGKVRLEARHHQRRGDRLQPHADFRPRDTGNRCWSKQFGVAGTLGERAVPVQRAAKGRVQALACEGEVDVDLRGRRPGGRKRGRIGHLGDRCNAGDRFLRELSERVRNGADQFTVDIDRAAAHAGNHAGRRERAALESREDQVAVGADDVLEHAEDVGFELFDARAVEDRSPDADHPWSDFVDAHLSRLCG